MDLFVQKLVYLALFIVLITAIWRVVKGYLKDNINLKEEVKNFIYIAIFLGVAPGLVEIFFHTGESLVKPVEAVIKYAAGLITDGIYSAMSGR